MLAGQPLNWFRDIYVDVPVAILPESGGPADDLNIEQGDGARVEAQVKKGLRADARLWDTLDVLAQALHDDRLDYAALIIDPRSSRSIRDTLAKAIVTISRDQPPPEAEIVVRWKARLEAKGICITQVCKRLRIAVVHATLDDRADIETAQQTLQPLLADDQSAERALDSLYVYVQEHMQTRGRMTCESVMGFLARRGFLFRSDRVSYALLADYRRWVEQQNSSFAMFALTGGKRSLSLDNLLPIKVCRYTRTTYRKETLDNALKRYREGAEAKRYTDQFAVEWLARFKRLAVIVAGPGQGKSVALKVLANRYSVQGYYVLAVRLKNLVALMKGGVTFKAALLSEGLDSSPLSYTEFLSIGSARWVLLADGLDECAQEHDNMAREIRAFVQGHAGMRAVVTTRQIGYETAELESWAHYEIIPPAKEQGASNLSKLMQAVGGQDCTAQVCDTLAELQLHKSPAATAISSSPQLLVMAACLLLEDDELPQSSTALYIRFLQLYGKIPSDLDQSRRQVADTVLNVLGWHLRQQPAVARRELTEQCTSEIARIWEMDKWRATREVEIALAHWEKLGLVEVLSHAGTELLTFTHLSFAEFLAARHLRDQSGHLLAEVANKPEWQEVMGYAVELGMAHALARHLWARHCDGDTDALCQALDWAARSQQVLGATDLPRLIGTVLEVLDDPLSATSKERLKIGLGLCGIAAQAREVIEPWLRVNLQASDATSKLIAWAIDCQMGWALHDAGQLRRVYFEMLAFHGKVPDLRDYFPRRERYEHLLLELVALALLKSCALDDVQAVAEELTQDRRLQGGMDFPFRVSQVLFERGIRPQLTESAIRDRYRNSFTSLTPPSPEAIERYRNLSRRVSRLLAEAFANGTAGSLLDPRPLEAFPQFSALLSVAELDRFQLKEEFEEHWPADSIALGSVLRDFSRVLDLDLGELAWESSEVLRRLDSDPVFTLFDYLPNVDCEYDSHSPKIHADLAAARFYILNGVFKTRLIAGLLLLRAHMSEQDVIELLDQASGPGLVVASMLVTAHCPDTAIGLLVAYLQRTTNQSVACVVECLQSLEALPEDGLEVLVMGYLTSDCPETVMSAIDIIRRWVEGCGYAQVEPIAHAQAHWQNRPGVVDRYDRDVHGELKRLLDTVGRAANTKDE